MPGWMRILWVVVVVAMVFASPLLCHAEVHDDDGGHGCACICHTAFASPPEGGVSVSLRVTVFRSGDESTPTEGVRSSIFRPPIV